MIAFISGHLDVTQEEFNVYYAAAIMAHALRGGTFIVGDARGADALAQQFLSSFDAKVVVYHMFESPRNNHGGAPLVGGFTSDATRDAAMTAASDIDIAWVRPGREKSGTAKNLARRGL